MQRHGDLISGNVKRVDYQKDQPDRFHHSYTYDADNRITEVETSADGQNWHRDARYFYYPHGPLERVELGEHLVQGMDYAYTLQGWLKGINSDRLNPTTDMGRDGDPSVTTNPNLLAGRDAYALSLGYYGDADYKGIASSWDDNTPASIVQRPIAPIGASGTANTVAEAHKPLYNGNIAHTVNTLQHFGLWDAGNGAQGQVLAQVYHYDQLNRLKKARGFIGMTNTNTWSGVVDAAENRYRSEYEYDANGNIVSAERWDEDGTGHYDSFEYHYQEGDGRTVRNRLYELFDDAPTTTGTDIVAPLGIFDNSTTGVNANNNYGYDALGNLVRDDRANILTIDWTVAGKVKEVDHATGMGPDLSFAYGADGQRIVKTVGYPEDEVPTGYREHYIRDAQGSIMATYRFTNTIADGVSLKLTERPVYGSSRLGTLRKEDEELRSLPSFDPFSASPIQQIDLNYELTDHLGNVCAVVTGRLLDGNGGGTPKQADLLSAQGYEAFGSLLPGRSYSSDSYAHGFNGMRKDDEMHGATGTSYDFGARIYDSRIGRWLSIDALANKYPSVAPYNFTLNNPILFVDPDGRVVRLYSSDGCLVATISKSGMIIEKGMENSKMVLAYQEMKAYFDPQDAQIFAEFESHEKYLDVVETLSPAGLANFVPSGIVNISGIDVNGNGVLNVSEVTSADYESSTSFGVISWNPELGAIDGEGNKHSPAMVYMHELGHAKHFKDNLVKYVKDVATLDSKGVKNEENRTIEDTNKISSRCVGDGGDGSNSCKRETHSAIGTFHAKSATSTEQVP